MIKRDEFDANALSKVTATFFHNYVIRTTHIYQYLWIGQGLLYLDGRNSQKYLHQTKADF